MGRKSLIELVIAERLNIELESRHWEGDVKIRQDLWMNDSKFSYSKFSWLTGGAGAGLKEDVCLTAIEVGVM